MTLRFRDEDENAAVETAQRSARTAGYARKFSRKLHNKRIAKSAETARKASQLKSVQIVAKRHSGTITIVLVIAVFLVSLLYVMLSFSGLLAGIADTSPLVSSPLDIDWRGRITSYYGYRVHPIHGDLRFHRGIDISLPEGMPVLAAHNGVAYSGYDPGGYGNYVTITGENGIVTRYGHCSEILAESGQVVAAGEVIALSGNTGASTGPHLHFELLINGKYADPIFFTGG